MAVIPIRGPVTAEHKHVWIDGPAIEISNLRRVLSVREIHDGDTALVPRLHFDVATGNGNQRTVVCDAVFGVALRGRHLVVVSEFQLVVL